MRSSRWLAPTTLVLFGFFLALAVVTRSDGSTAQTPVVRHAEAAAETQAVTKQQRTQLRRAARQVGKLRALTWQCQDTLNIERSRASTSVWALPQSVAYRVWVAKKWVRLAHGCQQILHSHDSMIRSLERGLAGTPMAGTGRELEAAGRHWGINPAVIAAIAGTESSFGAARCGHYNAYGLANCTGIWNVPYFRSWGDSYEFMGKFLSSRWPHARTPYDYNGYAACDDCWARKTVEHMGRFGLGTNVRY